MDWTSFAYLVGLILEVLGLGIASAAVLGALSESATTASSGLWTSTKAGWTTTHQWLSRPPGQSPARPGVVSADAQLTTTVATSATATTTHPPVTHDDLAELRRRVDLIERGRGKLRWVAVGLALTVVGVLVSGIAGWPA